MLVGGTKIVWEQGKIKIPAGYWRSPSKRRLPRLLIEGRSKQVGIFIYIENDWVVFQESELIPTNIDNQDAVKLEVYQNKFHMIPEKFKRQDSYEYMQKMDNALLLWSTDNKYFIEATKRPKIL